MDAKKALAAYRSQKSGAERRGIGWELTFKQWCDWWGEDIDKRGRHVDSLQMQRIRDEGPYALGNIIKGHPKQNTKTWVAMRRNREQEFLRRRWAAMESERSSCPPDQMTEDEQELAKLGYATFQSRYDDLAPYGM